jgi:hypothetical protein
MGQVLELVTGFVTAPGAVLTPLGYAAGNAAQVRNFDVSKKALLLGLWTQNQAVGIGQVISPKMHDDVLGIHWDAPVANMQNIIPEGHPQSLFPTDILAATLSGSAVGGQIETMCALIYYEDVPGLAGRFMTPADVKTKTKQIVTNRNVLVPGIAGGYSGAQAFNLLDNLLKANTDYAIIGYKCNVACAAIRYLGSDFGNLGLGGPGVPNDPDITANWFVRLSELHGLPLIPVFNRNNVGALFIDCAQNQAAAGVTVTTILAELG